MHAKIIGGSADSEMPVVTTRPLAAAPWLSNSLLRVYSSEAGLNWTAKVSVLLPLAPSRMLNSAWLLSVSVLACWPGFYF